MITTLKHKLGRDGEEGFTLIELMVVVLIIAILLAIAIPTFLGARNKANARAAQSDLRNALTAEQTFYTDGQAFATSAQLSSIEPNINFSSGAPTATVNTVGVTLGTTTDQVFLQALGNDHNCYTEYQSNGTASTTEFLISPPVAGVPTCPAETTAPSPAAVAGSKAGTAPGTWGAGW